MVGITPLQRSHPEALGISSAAVASFIEAIEQHTHPHTHPLDAVQGFMLLRHGSVAAEGWWAPYGPEYPHSLYSLSKSFASTAIGLAVAEGLLSVDDSVLKFFPGVSPVEPLVEATWGVLTFGLVGGHLALVLTAIIETIAGLALISGVFARFGLAMLAVAFVGILSPLVFFPGELFTAAGPKLLGQYVVKNVVLIAAALVVASKELRGPVRSAR